MDEVFDFTDYSTNEPFFGEVGYKGDIDELLEYPCNCEGCMRVYENAMAHDISLKRKLKLLDQLIDDFKNLSQIFPEDPGMKESLNKAITDRAELVQRIGQ